MKKSFLSMFLALMMFIAMLPTINIQSNADYGSGDSSSNAETNNPVSG